MARRRLTPAQPGYLGPAAPAPETKAALSPRSVAPIAQVSGQSAEAAALRELAQGIETARQEGRLIVEVPLADVAPEHLLRDRVSLDREALDALKASIRAHGQRIPAEIVPLVETSADDGAEGRGPYRYSLISGWRRLRALAELTEETDDPRFSVLRALIRQTDDAAEAYVAMVEENEIRVDLSYYERARLVAEVTARGVFPDQGAALRALFATASRAKRSKIASFTDIHERLGDVLRFPSAIPERLGLALVARLRAEGGDGLRRTLSAARPATASAELTLAGKICPPAPSGCFARETGRGNPAAGGGDDGRAQGAQACGDAVR